MIKSRLKSDLKSWRRTGSPLDEKTANEINYGYNHKDPTVDIKLTNLIHSIVCEKPTPMFYAKAWSETYFKEQFSSPNVIEKAKEYFSSLYLADNTLSYLKGRHNNEQLITHIYTASCIFNPLILIENEKFTEFEIKYSTVIGDKLTLYYTLSQYIDLYSSYLNDVDMFNVLYRYVNNITYSDTAIKITDSNITRTQFAILIMLLSGMDENSRIITLNKSILIMDAMISRKPTKVLSHILCCIVYLLLQKHSSNNIQKRKSHCREMTANILNAISPRDFNNEPYSKVNRRSVQVALTGK